MSELKTVPEKFTLSNLIMFPGQGYKTKADRLLIEFADICLSTCGSKEKGNKLEVLRQAIFSYVTNMKTQERNL